MIKKLLHQAGQSSSAIIRQAAAPGKAAGWRRLGLGVAAAVVLAQVVAVAFHQGALHRERALLGSIDQTLAAHGTTLNNIRRESQLHIDALSSQLARLQSRIARLDALGGTLVDIAQLKDGKEFDFGSEPGLGGDAAASPGPGLTATNLGASLDGLHNQIEDRTLWLSILEDVIQHRRLVGEAYPSGWPVRSGWVSSYYGMRRDPFHGRPAFHQGIDFAASKGTEIRSAAAGMVEFAGSKDGYGLMVQIRHGSGYQTRYGHASKLLVKSGQMVKRGDVVAHVGSTGRSTAPHLHFEVLKNGKAANPLKFLSARR
ncbi:MAG: M23 family metallopeptidase [Gammaproteobacteria bacterium]|nr:M23 family metallopeptidase [Gammaproteobacteria bacterium]